VLSGDHQNKPDIGVNIARQWIDSEKVDAIADTPNSGVALAVSNLVREKNAILLNSGAATADLTGKACTPNTISFTYDTYMLANGTGKALTKAGGDTWFFLTSDYAFGHALERDTSAVVTASGGKVLGSVNHPLNTSDFSSFLLQAQASKAKVVGLANAGGDTTNAIKQASEFGIVAGGQKLAALLLFITDVNALGLKTAQGLTFTESFYWDMNDQTRAWSKRFEKVSPKGMMPSMTVAGNYAAVLHYLKALEALGGNPHDGAKVVAKMKEIPTDDPLFGKGPLRADGRRIIPAYLFEVKKPDESKYPWDYYKLVATISPEDAAVPIEKSECPLIKK
jgi:branched-chain amino acid transport system substrate-binding protein